MRTRVTLNLLLLLSIAGGLYAADILSRLGVPLADAKRSVIESLHHGFPLIAGATKPLKAAPPAVRAAMVTEALTWIKGFTQTAEFREAWAGLREANKPEEPEIENADDTIRQQREDMARSIEEMKKAAAAMPADQRKEMEAGIREMLATMKEMEKSAEGQKLMKDGIEAGNAGKKEDHAEKTKKWQSDYPADPRLLIARHLRAFLAASADVDFNARLVPKNGRNVFAEARYEQKPKEWKLCYRAGKESVDAARAFATSWLAELEKK